MTDDAELLRRYAEENAEEAFAEFVRRNLGLVYHAALRQCGGDVHRAQDVAQAVFTDVARKARSLVRRPALAGWLHTSTRYAAAQAVRGEVRRQRREREAHAMNEILAKANGDDAAAAEWERMRPVIDEALHALPERDREAVLARFFEERGFAEVGARLALSEDAARMRVERALEKLRVALVKRGVNSTAAALGVALANQAGAAVPVGLAASVTGAALGAVGVRLLRALGLFMKKNLIAGGAIAVVAIGVALVRSVAEGPVGAGNSGARGSVAATKAVAATPVMAQRMDGGRTVAGVDPTAALPTAKPTLVEVPMPAGAIGPADAAAWAAQNQKRAIMNNLRMLAAGRDAFLKFKGRLPASLDELVGEGKMMRELKPVAGEDYSTVRLGDPVLSVTMADGTAVVLNVGAATPKGPPTIAESAAWERALSDYLRTRTASPELQMPEAATKARGIELMGLVETPEGMMFLLKDGAGSAPLKLKLGQRIGRYVLADYHAGDDTLTLQDGETTQRVKLREAKVMAPFAAETEVAYQLIREVQRREGWPIEAIRVQRPQRVNEGPWLVFAMHVLERSEQRTVLGDRISATVSSEGRVLSYTNRGRAK